MRPGTLSWLMMTPRTLYELTESGRALEPVIRAFEAWS